MLQQPNQQANKHDGFTKSVYIIKKEKEILLSFLSPFRCLFIYKFFNNNNNKIKTTGITIITEKKNFFKKKKMFFNSFLLLVSSSSSSCS